MSSHFSPIQNAIIARLKNADTLRYSQLHPGDDTPNDLFNYHLQFLVKKGYIERGEDGYSLSAPGIRHVADYNPSPDDKKIESLYKVNVITIVSRLQKGKLQILNQKRKSHPSYGKVGVMGGVVLKGELLTVAAKRKLEEETGLRADFFTVGLERRLMYVKDSLFSDVLFPICYASTYTGELKEKTSYGENLWVDIDEAIKNERDPFDSIASITDTLLAIKTGNINTLPFFFKESIRKGHTQP